MAGLSEEQLEQAKKTAVEWSPRLHHQISRPALQRARQLTYEGSRYSTLRQGGMRVFILSAWKTEAGRLRSMGKSY